MWAATWQNEQSDCAPSEVSDQPGHPPSLIRIFAVRMKKAWVISYPLSAQRRLWSAWLEGCPGSSESSLGAQRRLRSAWTSAQSDQNFAVRMKTAWVFSYPLSTQRRLWSAWLDGCPGSSESSLGAQSLCWFCHVAAHFLSCERNVHILAQINFFLDSI